MNLDAVALFGRANPEMRGASPFSATGSAVCIDPSGIVATCCHTFSRFMDTWSPHLIERGRLVLLDDVERHERPFFFFPSAAAWVPQAGEQSGMVYPINEVKGDEQHDVAVVQLGCAPVGGSLPYIALEVREPRPGEVVRFAGHGGLKDAQFDSYGLPKGWRLIDQEVEVVACTPEGFLIDYPVEHGMSGSGVCSRDGGLLGIISENWPVEHSLKRLGVAKSLGLVAYAQWLIPQLRVLRSTA